MSVRFIALVLAAFTAVSACCAACFANEADAEDIAAFYRGKRIILYIGTGPGGSYHAYAQNFAHHLGRYVPGNPTVVTQNMPGAGSVILANYLYNVAPRDGTVIGTIQQSIPIMQALSYEEARFEADRFSWIGDQAVSNSVGVFWHAQQARTIQDAVKKEVVLAAEGGITTSNLVPLVMNDVLKTRFRLVKGFPGGGEMNLAMERGEVDGRGAVAYAGWLSEKPEWVAQKKLIFFIQAGPTPDQELPDTPLLSTLSSNSADRALLDLVSLIPAIGRPIVAPPGVPAGRIKALRDAFMKTMDDPQFRADCERLNMRITPRTGDTIAREIHLMSATPSDVIARLRAIARVP